MIQFLVYAIVNFKTLELKVHIYKTIEKLSNYLMYKIVFLMVSMFLLKRSIQKSKLMTF